MENLVSPQLVLKGKTHLCISGHLLYFAVQKIIFVFSCRILLLLRQVPVNFTMHDEPIGDKLRGSTVLNQHSAVQYW